MYLIFRLILFFLIISYPGLAWSKTLDFVPCNQCVTLSITDINDIWYNAQGGVKKKASYLGFTEVTLDVDLSKFSPLGNIHVSGENNRGSPPTNSNYQTLDFISNIENYNQTKLYEVYYEQSFDKWYIKLGKFDFMRDFEFDDISSNFLNASMVTSMVINNDTYNMSNYGPMGNPGAEISYSSKTWNIKAAVSGDNPYHIKDPSNYSNIPADPRGTDLYFNQPVIYLEVSKLAYVFKKEGHYALGLFWDTGKQDITYSDNYHGGNQIIYATANQQVFKHNRYSLSLFSRFALDLKPNRAVINSTVDTGLLLYRGLDFIGISYSLAKINRRSQLIPESRIEFTAYHTINSYWSIQPDVQYIIHPGGTTNQNEILLGLRSTLVF